jgi:uncharacterized protein YpmB
MNKRLVWWIVIVLCIVFTFSIRQFYIHIQEEQWASEKKMAQIAVANSLIQKVSDTEFFYGEQKVGIVYGTDFYDKQLIVMIADDKVWQTFKVSELFPKETIKQVIREQYPNAEVVRITPGVKNSEFVWEVYFKSTTNDQTKHYYAYYGLRSGTFIDKFLLSPRF